MNHTARVPEPAYSRSSWCCEGGCIEVAVDDDSEAILVRRSHDAQELGFDFRTWSAFVMGVKKGEFDFR